MTGDTKWSDGITYVFIRGVLAVEGTETTSEHIGFSEDIWTKIHEEEEKYFPGQEVVGWFLVSLNCRWNQMKYFKGRI